MSQVDVRIYTLIETTINSAGLQAGSRTTPTSLQLGGAKHDASFSITNSSGDNYNSDIIWQAGGGGLDSFDLLYLEVDADAIVELQNDAGDAMILQLTAGVPLILGSAALVDGTLGSDGSATTVTALIDAITVKNNTDGSSADVTVNGRLLLID